MPSVGKNWRSVGVLTWFLKGPFPTTPPFKFWCKEKQPETCFNNKFCKYPAVTKHECSVASSSDPFISSPHQSCKASQHETPCHFGSLCHIPQRANRSLLQYACTFLLWPATAASYQDAKVQVCTSDQLKLQFTLQKTTTVLLIVLQRCIARVKNQHMLLRKIKTCMENCTEFSSCLFSFCQTPFSALIFVLTQQAAQRVTPSLFSGVPPTFAEEGRGGRGRT